MKRLHILWIKFHIRLQLLWNRSSMNEKTSRLLLQLVDLENTPDQKKYRVIE
jgi:hypothetical protein